MSVKIYLAGEGILLLALVMLVWETLEVIEISIRD